VQSCLAHRDPRAARVGRDRHSAPRSARAWCPCRLDESIPDRRLASRSLRHTAHQARCRSLLRVVVTSPHPTPLLAANRPTRHAERIPLAADGVFAKLSATAVLSAQLLPRQRRTNHRRRSDRSRQHDERVCRPLCERARRWRTLIIDAGHELRLVGKSGVVPSRVRTLLVAKRECVRSRLRYARNGRTRALTLADSERAVFRESSSLAAVSRRASTSSVAVVCLASGRTTALTRERNADMSPIGSGSREGATGAICRRAICGKLSDRA
jgi:hypothetical protein